MAPTRRSTPDPVVEELASIKRLLALTLLRSGASQKVVGAALGIDQSQVSRMFPEGIGKVS
jgi:predicted transcriptional regulator